mmetsp:Transcript_8690/g.14429  ORF Transcript_8690/g.14429 Transcript_8690/m.14429 type:complete len:213 (+) Transcript_8690:936-1574(+)
MGITTQRISKTCIFLYPVVQTNQGHFHYTTSSIVLRCYCRTTLQVLVISYGTLTIVKLRIMQGRWIQRCTPIAVTPPPAAAAAAAGRYCVRVHCSATADGAMQDLAVVDDLLMLITHLVVAPQLPSAAATTAASGRCEEDRTCSGTGSTSRHRGSGSSSIAGLLSSSIQSLKRSSRSSNHNNDNETIVRAKKPSSGFLQMRGNSRKQIQPSG